MFLCCAGDDRVVPPANSLAMYRAILDAGLKAELHIFQKGGHGFGVQLPDSVPTAHWPELFVRPAGLPRSWRADMRTVVPIIALIFGLAATPALALDYRVASRTEAGLGLVDADTVTVVGENRRVQITAVLPPETAPAVGLEPAIGEVLETLRGEPETLLARMSGSGATCFALCADEIQAEGLAERIEQMRRAWWRCPCGATLSSTFRTRF
eukprot:gene40053-biopygen26873